MIDGRWVMRDRELLTLDEAQVRAEAQRIATQVGAFLARREQSLLDKLVALGTLQWGETYEVQVKVWVPDEEALLARLLACPEVMVIKPSERKQYDTYFFFDDPEERHHPLSGGLFVGSGHGGQADLQSDAARLTPASASMPIRCFCRAPASRRMPTAACVSTASTFSPRTRERWTRSGAGGASSTRAWILPLNLDRLIQPPSEEVYLELKARTWSKHDALQKAEMISELLDVLAVDKAGLVQDEYVSF